MKALLRFNAEALVAMSLGAMLAIVFGIQHPENSWLLRNMAVWVLALGIYIAATGIDLQMVKAHRWFVIIALTFCVVMKWLIVSSVMFFIIGLIAYWLCIELVQIDPITTRAIKGILRLTKEGEHVIATISTFDDLVTSLASIISMVTLAAMGIMQPMLPDGMGLAEGWASVLAPLLLAAIATIYVGGKSWHARRSSQPFAVTEAEDAALKAASGAVAAATLVGGAGVVGLTVRPRFLQREIGPGSDMTYGDALNKVIFWVVFVMLGMLIPSTAMAWKIGFVAGTVAYFVQVPGAIAAFRGDYILRRRSGRGGKFPLKDACIISLAQLLGLTAVSLGVNGEFMHVWQPPPIWGEQISGPLSMVLPAIVVCNAWHLVCNLAFARWGLPWLDRRLAAKNAA